MKTNVGIAKQIVAACVVATGIAIVWGVVGGWLAMMKQSLTSAGESSYDSVMVAADGTPVIGTSKYTRNVSLQLGRRTLDGKPWPMDYQDFIQSAYFPKPYKEPGLVNTPLAWDQGRGRIIGGTDGKDPPAAWYFVRDNDHTGGVYATGFDAISKLPIGYIGRTGFRDVKPPLDEQFVLPKSAVEDGFTYLVSSGQNLEERRLVRSEQIFSDNASLWTVHLLGTDRMWEVNLRQRSARARIQFDGALSMGAISVNRAVFNEIPRQLPDERTDKQKAAETKEGEAEGFQYRGLTAVRQIDRLVLFNLHEGKKETFILPEILRDRRFSAFLVGPDQLLVDAHEQGDEYWSGGPIVRLYWTNRKGEIQREKEVKLAGFRPASPRSRAWGASTLIPIPVVWIVGMLLGAPLYLVQTNYVADFASGVSFVASLAWPPMVVVLLIAVALAWVILRLQRKYRRGGSGAWAVFVFLFGVPGFLAYLVEHRRAKLEACRQCGEIVPRDREACAACEAEFAAPARVGTEIFA
jgi:hypothetical protein